MPDLPRLHYGVARGQVPSRLCKPGGTALRALRKGNDRRRAGLCPGSNNAGAARDEVVREHWAYTPSALLFTIPASELAIRSASE